MPNINEEELWPWEYTKEEGGKFILWKGNSVTRKQLDKLKDKRPANSVLVQIDSILFHSLIFESAIVGNPNDGVYARWDCLNGWTTTIEEAKKKFPKGHHGKKHYRSTYYKRSLPLS